MILTLQILSQFFLLPPSLLLYFRLQVLIFPIFIPLPIPLILQMNPQIPNFPLRIPLSYTLSIQVHQPNHKPLRKWQRFLGDRFPTLRARLFGFTFYYFQGLDLKLLFWGDSLVRKTVKNSGMV